MSAIQPRYEPQPLQGVSSTTLETLIFSFLFVVSLVQFAGAWYWGATDIMTFDGEVYQPLGVPFRYLCWVTIAGSTGLFLLTRPYSLLIRAAMPFVPMWLLGVVSGFQGIDPVLSMRILTFWLLMACAACVAGSALRPRLLVHILFYVLAAMLVLSALVALAMPALGTMIYGGERVWRGVFAHKNVLGLVAMWTIVIAYLIRPTVGNWRAIPLILLATISLLVSGSKGPLVVAIGAIGYYVLLTTLVRARISTALGAGALSGVVIGAGVMAVVLWIPVTSALGRDPTLTGRTYIWAAYIQQALDSWLLGQGPGSFSGLSAITRKLFEQLQAWGNIKQPHNAFIAAFGDGGIVGLFMYLGALFYIAFVAPFRTRTPESLACAIGGFLLILSGLNEGRGVYNPSFDLFMVLVLRGLAVRSTLPGDPYKALANRSASASPAERLR